MINPKTFQKFAKDTPFYPKKFTKQGTVNLLYDPRRDNRVPRRLFDGTRLTEAGLGYLQMCNLHGYRDIPIEQATQILMESKQFYREPKGFRSA